MICLTQSPPQSKTEKKLCVKFILLVSMEEPHIIKIRKEEMYLKKYNIAPSIEYNST